VNGERSLARRFPAWRRPLPLVWLEELLGRTMPAHEQLVLDINATNNRLHDP